MIADMHRKYHHLVHGGLMSEGQMRHSLEQWIPFVEMLLNERPAELHERTSRDVLQEVFNG